MPDENNLNLQALELVGGINHHPFKANSVEGHWQKTFLIIVRDADGNLPLLQRRKTQLPLATNT